MLCKKLGRVSSVVPPLGEYSLLAATLFTRPLIHPKGATRVPRLSIHVTHEVVADEALRSLLIHAAGEKSSALPMVTHEVNGARG